MRDRPSTEGSPRRARQPMLRHRPSARKRRGKMKKLVARAVVVTTFASFVGAATANHAWGNYHWARTSNPFTLKLGDNLSSSWDAYLATTSSDWSKSTVLDTTV